MLTRCTRPSPRRTSTTSTPSLASRAPLRAAPRMAGPGRRRPIGCAVGASRGGPAAASSTTTPPTAVPAAPAAVGSCLERTPRSARGYLGPWRRCVCVREGKGVACSQLACAHALIELMVRGPCRNELKTTCKFCATHQRSDQPTFEGRSLLARSCLARADFFFPIGAMVAHCFLDRWRRRATSWTARGASWTSPRR